MPLKEWTSREEFGENVRKEKESGKSLSQALAIAYSMKRKSERKKVATKKK